MILKKEFYNIKCDCCGRSADEMWHDTEDAVRYVATESGWLLHWDKAYCPDCYDFDGNDNLIIKKGNNHARRTCNIRNSEAAERERLQ
jgi:glycine cleavage system aminomethyltransferase T